MESAVDVDVLIVGAGPTGLMLANQLGRRGVRVMLVDRHSGPAQQSRALAVQARTLEIYQKLGIADRALELGKPAAGGDLWADGKRKGRIPFGDAGKGISPYPYILILGQDDNERIMGAKLGEWNLAAQWNTELVALEQATDSVAATLKGADGSTRRVNAAWIAGCDGAHSAVRELNQIAFPGAPYEHVFFVADVVMTGMMVADELNIYLWKTGFHLFFPMRGKDHWRIVGIVPPELRSTDALDFDAVAPSVRGEAGGHVAIESCSWFSTYRIHHRAAAQFRSRRCFVLGDAAHIHSPVGGQGMNTGLQDAYNLAWKLALVVQGRADAALLDSYGAERIPVAQNLLRTTDRAFQLVVSDSPLVKFLRTRLFAHVAAFAMRSARVRRFAFRRVSQTSIAYPASPLSLSTDRLPRRAPQGGDRFPWLKLKLRADGPVQDLFATLDDMHFHLLAFGATPPERMPQSSGLMQVHAIVDDPANAEVLAQARIEQPSFYLLRPDGHVGLCGTHLDRRAVDRYFAEQIRMR